MKDRKLLNSELGRVSVDEYRTLPGSGIAVILDNVRSAHNVGSVFRSSDAFRIDEIELCGITACPPSAEIHKSALGAEDSVPWSGFADSLAAVEKLRRDSYVIVAVEQTENSVSLPDFQFDPSRKYAFIFGNEVDGVSQELVDASDMTLEIPQFGTKHSLNISVCAGIVLCTACMARRQSERQRRR